MGEIRPLRCPACGSSDVLSIGDLQSDPLLSFTHCWECERSRWMRAGEEIAVDEAQQALARNLNRDR